MSNFINRDASVKAWRDAIEAGDTFWFAKTTGDRDLIRRAWRRLKEYGADPLSQDMLLDSRCAGLRRRISSGTSSGISQRKKLFDNGRIKDYVRYVV